MGIGKSPTLRRRAAGEEMNRVDDRNGTSAGKFETVAGFCGDEVFAAGQPGCMSISSSPLLSHVGLADIQSHLPIRPGPIIS